MMEIDNRIASTLYPEVYNIDKDFIEKHKNKNISEMTKILLGNRYESSREYTSYLQTKKNGEYRILIFHMNLTKTPKIMYDMDLGRFVAMTDEKVLIRPYFIKVEGHMYELIKEYNKINNPKKAEMINEHLCTISKGYSSIYRKKIVEENTEEKYYKIAYYPGVWRYNSDEVDDDFNLEFNYTYKL